jgi:hypothetical protein
VDPSDGPIVVVAENELVFFSSTAAAEGYLEAIDVEEGTYTRAFDADGHPLRLRTFEVVEKGLFGLGHVRVCRVRIEQDVVGLGVQDARDALVAFLKEVDPHVSIDRATPIREIVRAAVAKYAVY